jgi:Tol biopolymer transport system component
MRLRTWTASVAMLLVLATSSLAQQPARVRWIATKDSAGTRVSVSPSGNLLLLETSSGLVVLNPTTGRTLPLNASGKNGAWSHKGDRIAFTEQEPGKEDRNLWSIPVDPATGAARGPAQRVSLTRVPNRAYAVSFSPDDRFVVVGGFDGRIVAVPATGGVERVIVDELFEVMSPFWSSDGSITYIAMEGAGEGRWVRRVSATGGASRRLFRAAFLVGVSVDGTRIAFHSNGWPYQRDGEMLKIADSKGTISSQLYLPATTYWGHLSADGSRYTFASLDVVSSLVQVDVTSGATRELTAATEWYRNPAYSPNGQLISAHRMTETGFHLVILDPSGKVLRAVQTPLPLEKGDPLWSSDNRHLTVASIDGSVAIIDAVTGTVTRTLTPRQSNGNVSWRDDAKALRYVDDESDPSVRIVRELDLDGRVTELSRVPTGTGLIRFARGDSILLDLAARTDYVDIRGGQKRTIYTGAHNAGMVHMSPDGKWLAMSFVRGDETAIKVVPTGGGAERVVSVRGGRTCGIAGVSWHPAGGHLIVGTSEGDCGRWDSTLIPLDGGAQRVVTAGIQDMWDSNSWSLSPDGRVLLTDAEWKWTTRIGVIDLPRPN